MENKKLGNSRLLYVSQDQKNPDINQALALIDNFILNSRQVELAWDAIIVYPVENRLLIGREVSGYPTELATGIEFKDFHHMDIVEEALQGKVENFFQLLEICDSRAAQINGKVYRFVFDIDNFDRPLAQYVKGD